MSSRRRIQGRNRGYRFGAKSGGAIVPVPPGGDFLLDDLGSGGAPGEILLDDLGSGGLPGEQLVNG